MTGPSWTLLTDTLLHRAVAQRSADGDTSTSGSYDRVIGEARNAFLDALDGPSVFARLVRRVRLGVEEAEVFAAVCAVDIEPGRQAMVARLGDKPLRSNLSLWHLAVLFGEDHAGPLAVAGDSLLVRAALVEVAPAASWSDRVVTPAPRVTWHLVGDDALDPRLPRDTDVVGAVTDGEARIELADAGDPDDTDGDRPVLFVVGTDPTRRLQAAVSRLRSPVCLVADAPADDLVWQALVREAVVSDTGIVVRVSDALSSDARHWIERTPHLAWAVSSPTELPLDAMPRRAWSEVLADDAHARADEIKLVLQDAAELGAHRLTAEQLRLVAVATSGVGGAQAAIRRLAAGPIDKLAMRVRPRLGWDDLVLPADQLARLHELTARYRNRGVVHGEWGVTEFPSPGVVALFAGASGTGKTTAAEVLAADLGVDLFKIDLSSVVSKYVGETEKNLEELFSAAQSGDLVLCFDEADALFGKRGEVSEAHDRYANIEVSYLLQRIETYEGFVVLTTNLQANIDDAFVRRLHARIDFPNPGPAERLRIWERSLIGVPIVDVDLPMVAERFELVGGSIRGAALTAAFAAAERGRPITDELLALGLKREFQKMGRMITRELFGEWYGFVV